MDEMDILRSFRQQDACLDEETSSRIRQKVLYGMALDEYLSQTREVAQACLIKLGLMLGIITICGYFFLLPNTGVAMKLPLGLVVLAALLTASYYAELNPHRKGRVRRALTDPSVD